MRLAGRLGEAEASQACGPPQSESSSKYSRARIAPHITERGSSRSAGAHEEAVGAVGRTQTSSARSSATLRVRRPFAVARGKRIIAISALLQRRNDQSSPRHRPFQHRMRRGALGQGGRRISLQSRSARRRAPVRSARAPTLAPSSQGQVRRPRSAPACRAQPILAGPSAASRSGAKLRSCSRNARATFRTRRLDEFHGAVAQEGLLRCQMAGP